MEALVFLTIAAAIIGGVVWNHKNRQAALDGVEFCVDRTVSSVSAAIASAYCQGSKAKVKNFIAGVQVSRTGPTRFRIGSKIGDVGHIEIHDTADGTVVKAWFSELYVGSHPKSHFRKGFMAIGAALAHGIYKLLGICPNAGRMKRFLNSIERRVDRQVRTAATA